MDRQCVRPHQESHRHDPGVDEHPCVLRHTRASEFGSKLPVRKLLEFDSKLASGRLCDNVGDEPGLGDSKHVVASNAPAVSRASSRTNQFHVFPELFA